MFIFIPAILFTLDSPYFRELRIAWEAERNRLLDCTEELKFILEETQIDVYNQFTENQGKWKALAKYTVNKKKAAKADMRIMHETRVGQGQRLKDAYAETGKIDGQEIVFYYPPNKPYAHEHQEGAVIGSPTKEQKKKRKGRKKKRDTDLDLEFLRKAGLPDYFADYDF